MITHDDMLHYKASKVLSAETARKMEHCVGFDRKKIYRRNGVPYFKPYRNHFMPGGSDNAIWENLKERGFADCSNADDQGHRYYWMTHEGLNILSAYDRVFIYSDSANGNEIDASYDVLQVLLDEAVYCGYGCWIPTPAKEIAKRARLPLKLTLDTLHYLRDKCGYAALTYEGGVDDEGFPHCNHGWVLSKKWIDEHRKEYQNAQTAEYVRMNEIGRGDKDEWWD